MAVQMNFERDKLFDELGLMRLRESYMRRSEKSPQERFAFVAETFGSNPEHAQRIYDYASRHWLSFSTPILSFGRSKKGLPISCFLTYMEDSAEGLVDTLSEVNWLSMLGGGVGIHVRIRSADEKSVGVMPHLKVYDAACLAYRQGSTRRGSYAAFLDIDHPDIIPFIEMRKPTGDQNMKALNLHHGVNLSDAFMEKIEASMRDSSYDDTWELRHPSTHEVVAKVSARDLWQRILEMRMHTGEPYLVFIDTANRALPSWLKDKGLSIHGSNLCTEIFLPTSHDRTAVCCLSSLNLEYFDEWKNNQQFITDAMELLDNVLQYFIDHAPDQIARARYSAMRERSVGLGALGFHAYLQKKGVPFESAAAKSINKQVFRLIRTACAEADKKLCAERGIGVTVVDCVYAGINGEKIAVSSTEIRSLLSRGDVQNAALLLGRRYSLCGTVCRGKELGHTIGFPTANLLFDDGAVPLANGVYATDVYLGGKKIGKGITNAGHNPTVDSPDGKTRVETCILGYDGNLYGKKIKLEFKAFMRGEIRFSSIDELKAQLEHDRKSGELY